jgi:hypothetical protein
MNPLPPTPSDLRAAKAACQFLNVTAGSDTIWELALRIDRETHAKELRAALYESEVERRGEIYT